MGRLLSGAGRIMPFVAVLLVVAAGVLWWQRTPVLNWYFIRGLAQAEEGERATWIERVASLDADAVPRLMGLLRNGDAKACANGEAALSALSKRWGSADVRTAKLAEELTAGFRSLSTPGQEAALEWYLAQLSDLDGIKADSLPLLATARTLLPLAAKMQEKSVQLRSLALAEAMLERDAAPYVDLCRDLATRGMASKDTEICSRAIRLVMHAPLHAEKALLDQVLPLLKDAAPEVRRSAVATVGLAEDAISVQEMLPLLQDSDAEVRRLSELALRGRGLQDDHIKLAKSISDSRPNKRLEVLKLLDNVEDLDPSLWLVYLSQDPSPAVRAAAIRFAAEDVSAGEFQQRMLQMSREDPSQTVRQLAAFYLNASKR